MPLNCILIVDDNEADHFLNKVFLEKTNPDIELHQAYDGKEALALLQDNKIQPEAIFLDIYMTGMGGEEFLEEYSKLNYDFPVVVMTSSKGEEERFKSFDVVIGYEQKPVTNDVLQKVFDNISLQNGK